MAQARTFCIAGAGIAGLTLALALAKQANSKTKTKIILLERNDEITEFGAGLQLGPNAHRALDSLGLEEELHKVSFEPEGVDIFSYKQKKPIVTLKLGATAREKFGVPYSVIHRADLVHTLYNKVKKSKLIDVYFGVLDFKITNANKNPIVNFKCKDGNEIEINTHAFIGADGVCSVTRTGVLDGPLSKYSGYVAWRTLIDIEKLKNVIDLNNTSLMWGTGFHAVAYPLPHRNKVNIAIFTRETMSVGFGIRQTPSLPNSAKSDPRLSKILELADGWKHWPLAAVSTSTWHKGSVGLVGDAAHAMLPFQAQGAAMGIEDAVILAPLLMNEESPATAFEKYENKRQARVNKVIKTSATNGKIFHMSAPLSKARNAVVKMQGEMNHYSRLGWIYDYDPLV